MGDRPDPAVSALRIVSACNTAEQFVVAFARYCEQTSLFIATQNPKRLGEKVRFTLTLAGGNPVITGLGHVIESYPDRANRFERAGMRIRFDELDDMSRDWVRVLTSQKSRNPSPTVPTPVAAASDAALALPPPPIPIHAKSPPVESGDLRTPGSATVLPANPLGQVDEASLEVYVECSLYEVTPEELEAMGWDEDTDVVSPAAFLDALRHSHAAAVEKSPADKPAESAAGKQAASGTGPGKTEVLGDGTFGLDKVGPRADSRAESIAEEDLEPVSDDEGAGGRVDASMTLRGGQLRGQAGASVMYPPTEVDRFEPPQPLLRRRVSVMALIGGCLGTLVLGIVIGKASSPEVRTRGNAEAAAVASRGEKPTEASARDTPANPEEETLQAEAQRTEPAQPAVPADTNAGAERAAASAQDPRSARSGAGDCAITATSRPDAVVVSLGGKRIGETPLSQISVPCGRAVLRFERPRYQPQDKSIDLSPGHAETVSVRLERPVTRIRIDSNPRGATVKLRGRTAGTTPLSTTIEAFETSSIVISKPGYRTVKRSVRPRRETARVSFKLAREGEAVAPKR